MSEENLMDTPLKRALHYVECYHLQFPNAGAGDVVSELKEISDSYGEAFVMEHLVNAWNEFLKLPEIHGSDRSEFQTVIHKAQNIILARLALKLMLTPDKE